MRGPPICVRPEPGSIRATAPRETDASAMPAAQEATKTAEVGVWDGTILEMESRAGISQAQGLLGCPS